MDNPTAKPPAPAISGKIKVASIAAAAVVILFVGATIYYYLITSPATVLVTAEEFPTGFGRFTRKDLMDRVAYQLAELVEMKRRTNMGASQEGFGIRPAKDPLFKSASDSTSPAYQLEWRGYSLNVCRRLGMSLKVKRFLSLRVSDVSDNGWRLSAMMEEAPQYSARDIASAPPAGKLCSEFQPCVSDLAEQILRSLDTTTLLNFYIQQKDEESNKKILALYSTVLPLKSLKANDYVRWGDAFLGVRDYQHALEKYNAALAIDKNSCAALAARGYLYDKTARGDRTLNTLQLAKQDLRAAIKCDSQNKFSLTSLCHAFTQEWKRSQDHVELLEEAKQNCQRALDIDPNFVIPATNIGYILYRQGRHAESLQYFQDLARKFPSDSALFANYGFVLYLEYRSSSNADMLEQAIQQTRTSFDLEPASFVATNNLGFFYYESEDYSQATTYWNKAKTLNPKDADTLAGLALAKYKQDQTDEAKSLLLLAIEIDPQYKHPKRLEGDPYYWSNKMTSDLRRLIASVRL